MTAKLCYRIAKTRPYGDPDDAPLRWVLIRSGNVERESGSSVGLLPEVDVAVFSSEAEANLFSAWMLDMEQGPQLKP
jgi:hypothetical protein